MKNTPKTLTLSESDALAVRALAKCAARPSDHSRFCISGVLVQGSPRPYAAVTDGRRAAWAPLTECKGTGSAIVPTGILSAPKLDGLSIEGGKATATRGKEVASAPLTDGVFPPLDEVARVEGDRFITVAPQLLAELLTALANVATDADGRPQPVTLCIGAPNKPLVLAAPNGAGAMLMPVNANDREDTVRAAMERVGGKLTNTAPTAKPTEPPPPAPVATPTPAPAKPAAPAEPAKVSAADVLAKLTGKPAPAPAAPKPAPVDPKPTPAPKPAPVAPAPAPKPTPKPAPADLPDPAAALVRWGASFNGTGFSKREALAAGVVDAGQWSEALSAAYSAKLLRRVKGTADVRHTVCG